MADTWYWPSLTTLPFTHWTSARSWHDSDECRDAENPDRLTEPFETRARRQVLVFGIHHCKFPVGCVPNLNCSPKLREILSHHDHISCVVKPYVDLWLVQPALSQEQQFVTGAIISYRNRIFRPIRPIFHHAGLAQNIVTG